VEEHPLYDINFQTRLAYFGKDRIVGGQMLRNDNKDECKKWDKKNCGEVLVVIDFVMMWK
jgi:hypothetical protein